MKIIYNNIIPFKGFVAMNLFGTIFARKKYKPLSKRTINHEAIHTAQMKELLYIFFYILYALEWPLHLFQPKGAYRNISFEKEAYENDKNLEYLKTRKHFAWCKYFKQRQK